jgi:undecaprenyl diphosphate synthase
MDGNGRWAQDRGLARNEGHRAGVTNVERIVEAARELDIKYLTLYAFSVENWNRPRLEVEALMRLLEQFLKKQRTQLIAQQIRFQVLGRLDEMPPRVAKLLRRTIEETRQFSRWTLSLCLNYGARTELVDAMKNWGEAVKDGTEEPADLTWEKLASYLYTGEMPDPDLVIRTSGEHRISNFLLLQSAYAEYYFTELRWPDFGPEPFREAIAHYARRERRFGLTGEQIKAAHLPAPTAR